MAVTEPKSSMSLPKRAPSRKSGKNWAKKPAALRMKVCVQCARMGSRANRAAATAASGAKRSTLQPLKANQIKRPRPTRIPRSPTRSAKVIAQASESKTSMSVVDCLPMSSLAMLSQELLGASTAFGFQHREKRPLGIELGRGPEFGERIGHDAMRAHLRPTRAFALPGIGGLTQERDHSQLLHERRVERNLVETVQDVARSARRVAPFARVDLDKDRVVRVAFANKRRDGRVADVTSVPVRLAVDFYRMKHGRQTRGSEKHVRRDLLVSKHAPAASVDVGGGDEELDRGFGKMREIDAFDQDAANGVVAERIQAVRRDDP